MDRIAEKEQAILLQKDKKFYIQKVDDPIYLEHTMGPGKSIPAKEHKFDNSQTWRRILMREFLGCSFR